MSDTIFVQKNRFTLSGSVYRKEIGRMIGKMIGLIFGRESLLYRQFERYIENRSNVQEIPMRRTIKTMESKTIKQNDSIEL